MRATLNKRRVHHGCGAAALRKAALFFAVGVGEGGACQWWAMGGAARFAKRWSWLAARCRPHHLRFFISNHSRPIAATINTTMMLHGVDEVGSPLVVVGIGLAGGSLVPFFGEGDDTSDVLVVVGVVSV